MNANIRFARDSRAAYSRHIRDNSRFGAMHRQYLTFWHWSSVTPYTSSYEFAGSCVFDKQSPGRLLLQPPSRETRWWETYQSTVSKVQTKHKFSNTNEEAFVRFGKFCVCLVFCAVCVLCCFLITFPVMGAGLIPKLRPLFCRVPWRPLIRSPCSTRADYLCRFTVRFCRV